MNFSIFGSNVKNNKKIIEKSFQNFSYVDLEKIKDDDYIFVFGGDGTFLKSIHKFYNSKVKLIFINTGKVGFLSSFDKNEIINFRDEDFGNIYYLSLKTTKKELVAINEIYIDLDKLGSVSTNVNKLKLLDFYCSKIIFINYVGTTGLARTFRYPIILRNNISYIFDVLDSPQYHHNKSLHQPILFSNKNIVELFFKNKSEKIIKCDNVKYYINDSQLKISQKKAKCKILKIDNFDHLIKRIDKLI